MSQRLRLPALFCAAVFLVALLIGRPFAESGMCDDFSYVFTAKRLAETGHLTYVGWAGAMLGWQVYFAAALFHVFGFSFTVARVTTWLSAAVTAFLLQRILVRAGCTERNAVLGSLAFVLSPVFFMLSATFMTDVEGLLAVVVCLYSCIRALQEDSERAAGVWIVAAIFLNTLLGTSRQIAWLGALLIVPATLWLVRSRQGLVRAGVIALVSAGIFMLLSTYWFQHQPFTMTDSVAAGIQPKSLTAVVAHTFREAMAALLELPLLLLPVTAIFLPSVFRANRKTAIALAVFTVVYAALAWHWRLSRPEYLLEPTTGNWLGIYGYIQAQGPRGHGPVLLPLLLRALLTVGAIGGVLGVAVALKQPSNVAQDEASGARKLSLVNLVILLFPFTAVYAALLIPRGVSQLFDRYLIALLLLPLILLMRLYQQRVALQLPIAGFVLLALVAVFSVSCIHNTFAAARTETDLGQELKANGVSTDRVDFSWPYNGWRELETYGYIDNPAIRKPAGAYVPVPITVNPACYQPPVPFRYLTLDYAISYDPKLCSGQAFPFTKTYRTWPTGELTPLYVIRYTPIGTPAGLLH